MKKVGNPRLRWPRITLHICNLSAYLIGGIGSSALLRGAPSRCMNMRDDQGLPPSLLLLGASDQLWSFLWGADLNFGLISFVGSTKLVPHSCRTS